MITAHAARQTQEGRDDAGRVYHRKKNDEDFNEDDSELDPEEEEDDSDEEEYINGKFKKVKKRRGNRNKVKAYSNSGRGAHL